jgi:hypothetical protein
VSLNRRLNKKLFDQLSSNNFSPEQKELKKREGQKERGERRKGSILEEDCRICICICKVQRSRAEYPSTPNGEGYTDLTSHLCVSRVLDKGASARLIEIDFDIAE